MTHPGVTNGMGSHNIQTAKTPHGRTIWGFSLIVNLIWILTSNKNLMLNVIIDSWFEWRKEWMNLFYCSSPQSDKEIEDKEENHCNIFIFNILSHYKNNNNNNNASNDNNRWTFIKALSSFLIRDHGVGFTVPILFFSLQKKRTPSITFFDQPTMVASYSVHDVPSVLWHHNVLRQHHPFFCKERRVTLWLRRSPGEGNGAVMPRVKNEQSNFIQNEKSPTSLHP